MPEYFLTNIDIESLICRDSFLFFIFPSACSIFMGWHSVSMYYSIMIVGYYKPYQWDDFFFTSKGAPAKKTTILDTVRGHGFQFILLCLDSWNQWHIFGVEVKTIMEKYIFNTP